VNEVTTVPESSLIGMPLSTGLLEGCQDELTHPAEVMRQVQVRRIGSCYDFQKMPYGSGGNPLHALCL